MNGISYSVHQHGYQWVWRVFWGDVVIASGAAFTIVQARVTAIRAVLNLIEGSKFQ